jgi:hypothetical protein
MVEAHYRSNVGSDPTLQVWFYVRLYKSGRMWIRAVVENGYLDVTTAGKSYIPTVTIGGTVVYNNSGNALTHYAHTRWTAEGWIGGDPQITPKHDTTYLMSTKLVPNYGWLSPSATALNNLYQTYAPNQNLNWSASMGSTGAQSQIGLLPMWDALFLTSGADSRAYNSVLANAKALNSYAIVWDDSATHRPTIPTNRPTWTVDGAGQGGETITVAGSLTWDVAHHGSGGYLAYLITGDYLYLETMEDQASTVYLVNSSAYGSGTSRLMQIQTRAIAWAARTIGQLAAIGPSADPIVTDYKNLLAYNVTHWSSVATQVGMNQIGYLNSIEMSEGAYDEYGVGSTSPWQQHFWVQTYGYLSDIEPLASLTDLITARDYLYKSIVGILGPNGASYYCYSNATNYTIRIAAVDNWDPTSWYTSWGAVFQATWGGPNTSCGSNLGGTSGGDPGAASDGYWGNLLPAIAYAVDHAAPGASTAWSRMTGATNWSTVTNSGFNDAPVWGIVPRGSISPPPPPPPPASTTTTENWKLLPNSSLRTVLANTNYIVSPGTDGWSYPPDNIVKDWNGGIIDTKRKMMIVPAAGGHNSWFYNDVWGYDSVNFKWVNLRKSYLPYMTIATADQTHTLIYSDGSPSTVHTYDGISYLEQLDTVFMIGGPGWNSTGQGPPPRLFSMSTANWSYGTSQGIYPENGTCSAVNPADGTVWFRTATRLYSYNVQADTYTVLSDNLTNPQTYYTALVVNGIFYMFGGGAAIKIVPGQPAVQLSLSGEPLPAVPAPGVAWEPALQRVILWGGGTDVYFVDLAGFNVSKKTVSGDAPGPSQGLGTYKRFGRVSQGQYLLLNSLDGVYLLTLDTGSVPPPATTPPSTQTPAPTPTPPTPITTTSSVPVTLQAQDMPTKTTGGATDQGWEIWANGYIEAPVNFPTSSRYRFLITARGDSAAGIAPIMELRIDQRPVGTVTVPSITWSSYTIDADIAGGTHNVAVAFTNDYYNPPDDRNLYVNNIAISLLSLTTTNPPLGPGLPSPSDGDLVVGTRVGEVLQGRVTPIVVSTTLLNVTKMELRIDGVVKATANSNSIRYAWNPKETGTHTVEVLALNGTSVLSYWNRTVTVR